MSRSGPVEPGTQQRRRLGPGLLHARSATRHSAANSRHSPGRPRRDSATAGALPRAGRVESSGQFSVRLVVAGQQRQRDTMRATGLGQTLDPIGPIGAAAEQPGDDQPRAPPRSPYRDRPRNCGRAAGSEPGAGPARSGSCARSRACAAASSANSVSALDNTTISPGVCPRSIAAEPSVIVPGDRR